MKNIDDEENMTWPNLKAMLAVVPKEPGTLFIALCCDYTGSTSGDFPSEVFPIIAMFYIPALHGLQVQFHIFATNNSAPNQSLQFLKKFDVRGRRNGAFSVSSADRLPSIHYVSE